MPHTLGVTDLPRNVKEKQKDLLKIDKYAEGLCEFIKSCNTPMSIALQGDWGSGKTSLLNYIENNFDKDKSVKILSINTWQYSQMKQGDTLSALFIISLLNKMGIETKTKDSLGKKVGKVLGKIALSAAGADSDIIDEMKECLSDIELVEQLQKEFKEAVNSYIEGENNRLVILVDDLDRLNPNVAVELLEVIKLFMDVENCIFVLAIDYDVVVQGVRSKFGETIKLEKCRSFFDKIIQLPFHMPVEKYELDDMIEQFLKDDLDKKHIGIVSDFAEEVIGANPRATKRITNSFILLKIIHNNTKEDNTGDFTKEDYALLFCVLCIQVKHAALYKYLSNIEDWRDSDNKDLFSYEIDDDDDDEKYSDEDEAITAWRQKLLETLSPLTDDKIEEKYLDVQLSIIRNLCNVLRTLYTSASNKGKGEENYIYNCLSKVVNLSAVTNRESASVTEKPVLFKGSPVTIKMNGVETPYKNATEAFVEITKKLLKKHSNLINESVDYFKKFLTTDPDNKTRDFYTESKKAKHSELLNDIFYLKGDEKLPVYIGKKSDTLNKKDKEAGIISTGKIFYIHELLKFLDDETSIEWTDKNGYFVLQASGISIKQLNI